MSENQKSEQFDPMDDRSSEISEFLSPASFWFPDALVESAWHQHAPFGFWLIEALKPRTVVELGTHRGFSYLVFCQAVQRLQLEAKCYAIDTWKGDEHAGFYDEEVYESLSAYHNPRYRSFSRLVRSTFDDALAHFPDRATDLLHIDGRHFYEDVKHDFETWKEKLSDRAIVVFHDTNVRERGFGVSQLWTELKGQYPGFEFFHGHGLGVLGAGDNLPKRLKELFEASSRRTADGQIRDVYARLGMAVEDRIGRDADSQALRAMRARAEELSSVAGERADEIARLQASLEDGRQAASAMQGQIDALTTRVQDAEKTAETQAEQRRVREKELSEARERAERWERDAARESHRAQALDAKRMQARRSVRRASRAASEHLAKSQALESELAGRREQVRSLENAAGERDARIRELEQMLAAERAKLGELDRKTRSSRWLFRRAARKIVHAPRDITRRLRWSRKTASARLLFRQIADKAVHAPRDFSRRIRRSRKTKPADIVRPRLYPRASMSRSELEQLLALKFPEVEQPEISIIIPVYNQIAYTAVCLHSLLDQKCTYSFEVIVMDDGSTDRTQELLSNIPGLRYHRNASNLGFNRNCNRGAELARGQYLVFLNNDTEVLPGWLAALRDIFHNHSDVGIAGSMLIYPDGQLQEAGGIIWEDGNGWNWGRFKDPHHPRYNFVRDVDYVSGASIMVPHELFFRLGKFAEELDNSYYEDTWLAFAAREAGYRVLYQPRSQLIHFEGITCGRSEGEGIKRYQALNRQAFFNQWYPALKHNLKNGSNPEKASDRLPKGHILIVDACTPTPDQDSGSVDMFNMMRILRSLNYRVHFIPQSNFSHFGKYTERLQELGVECIHAPFYKSVRDFLAERGDMFSHVILARMPVAEAAIGDVTALAPSARTIFYTVDMHGLRQMREAKLAGNAEQFARAESTLRRELALIERCNTAIVLSDYEAEFLRKKGYNNIAVVPLIRDCSTLPLCPPFEGRDGVAFIGGFQHTPNLDAVRWLYDEIWPRVRETTANQGLPTIPLKIVGSRMPDWMRHEAPPGVEPVGFVENLDDVFCRVRLSVAPLRYGAGLKGKVATSLEYGVPVVGTSMTFEGMPVEGLEPIHLCADDADALAERLVAVYFNEGVWQRASEAGRDYVRRHYSLEAVGERLKAVLARRNDGARKATYVHHHESAM